MGRPSKVDDERVVEAIIRNIKAGAPPSTAAAAAGVPQQTYKEWMARGKGTHRRGSRAAYAAFADRVREAEAHYLQSAAVVHSGLAFGRAVKREVVRTIINDEGAHEQVVEREYWPPNASALQWAMERRDRQHYSPPSVREFDDGTDERGGLIDADPTATREALDRVLDRYVASAGTAEGPPSRDDEARGDLGG